MKIIFVKELPAHHQVKQALVRTDESDPRYFIVSTSNRLDQSETLVFPANQEGKPTSMIEVAGYRGASRADALDDLADAIGAANDYEAEHGRKFR